MLEEMRVLLGMTTSRSSRVSIFVERIPTETTVPSCPSTSILSPTSNGLSSDSRKEFTMFPRLCWIASPMIKENTARDAKTPMSSMPNLSIASWRPKNQTTDLPRNIRSGLPPETVTADFLVNLSSRRGAKCLMTTLVRLVASRM